MKKIMILYHTGFKIIKSPDIHYGRKNADFGQGFYMTSDYEFSCRWAKEREGEAPIVNTYELDTTGLQIHRFSRDLDWFTYIFRNRRNQPDSLDADVIIGPIANDTIYDTMGIITSGYLKDEEALQLLLLGPEYHQIVLKTEKAASQLVWTKSRAITPEEISKYKQIVAAEQDEYLEAIGKAMETF